MPGGTYKVHTTRDVELKVPGDLIYLRPVRTFIRELTQSMDYSHERVNSIELAVDEIFSNAVEHGSASSGSRIVIHCLVTEERARVIVSDSGHGEDSDVGWLGVWSNSAKEEARPGTERGHGLLLAHNLTDEMKVDLNWMGGVDVHLVVYKEERRGRKNNGVCRKPQAGIN